VGFPNGFFLGLGFDVMDSCPPTLIEFHDHSADVPTQHDSIVRLAPDHPHFGGSEDRADIGCCQSKTEYSLPEDLESYGDALNGAVCLSILRLRRVSKPHETTWS